MVRVASVAQSIQPHNGITVEGLGYFITKVKVQSIPENMYSNKSKNIRVS